MILYSDREVNDCIQGCHQGGGAGGAEAPPQYLTDQLTLSQPGGADYARHSTNSPDFQTLRRAWYMKITMSLQSNLAFRTLQYKLI